MPNLKSIFEGRAELYKIISNIGWLLFEKVFRSLFNFLLIIWIARHYGVEQFGVLNFAIAFTALFSPIATLGLESIVVREIVDKPDKELSILGAAFSLRFIGATLAFILAVLVVFWLRYDDAQARYLSIILAGGLFLQSFDVIDYFFQAKVTSRFTVQARAIASLIGAALKVLCMVYHLPIAWIAWVMFLELLVTAGLLIYFFGGPRLYLGILTFPSNLMKTLLKEGLPLLWAGVLVIIYMRIDQTMLAKLSSDKAVGIYSAAVHLSEIWYFIPGILVNSIFPNIIQTKKQGVAPYLSKLQMVYDLLTLISLAACLFVTFTSDYLMAFIYGDAYGQSALVLSIHIWSSIFVFWGLASNKYLIIENLNYIIFYTTLIGASSNVILNLLFIPSYGVQAAAFSTLFSYGLSAYISYIFFPKSRIVFYMLSRSFNVFRIILNFGDFIKVLKAKS